MARKMGRRVTDADRYPQETEKISRSYLCCVLSRCCWSERKRSDEESWER